MKASLAEEEVLIVKESLRRELAYYLIWLKGIQQIRQWRKRGSFLCGFYMRTW